MPTELDYITSINGLYTFDSDEDGVDPESPFIGLPGDVFAVSRCFIDADIITLDQNKLSYLLEVLKELLPNFESVLMVEYYINICRYRPVNEGGIVSKYVLAKVKNIPFPITFVETEDGYLYFGFLCTQTEDDTNILPKRLTLVSTGIALNTSQELSEEIKLFFTTSFTYLSDPNVNTIEDLNSIVNNEFRNLLTGDREAFFGRPWWCLRR